MRRPWLLVVVALTVAGITASAAANTDLTFYSPSRNIGCELQAFRQAPEHSHAFCVTSEPPRCVTLKANGSMRVRRGKLCIGNPPENTFMLKYGRSVRGGPFRCTSRRDGMRCIVISTGHGFLISRERLTRF